MSICNLLYACSANRGRSPALAAYTKHFAPEYGLALDVDSVGTRKEAFEHPKNADGLAGPEIRGVLIGQEIGFIQNHKTKLFVPEYHGPWSDLILTADRKNADRIVKAYPAGIEKIYTAKDFAGLEESDIIDAHYLGRGDRMYMEGIEKDSPEAWRLMAAECEKVSKAVLKTIKANS